MPVQHQFRQFQRLLIAGNLIVLALLAGTTLLSLRASREAYTDSARQSVENLTRSVSQNVAAEIRQIDSTLATIIQELDRLQPGGPLDATAARAIIDGRRRLLPEVDGIRITDADGRVLTSDSTAPVSVGDRSYFAQARERPDALALSEPLMSRVTGRWSLVMARAWRGSDGRFLGVVYAVLSTEHFINRFEAVARGTRGAVALRTDGLNLVARYAPGATDRLAGIGSNKVSAELADVLTHRRESGFYITRTVLDGVERASAYQRVSGYPLTVLVGLDTEDFFRPWRREALQLSLLSGLLGVLVMTLSALVLVRQRDLLRAQAASTQLAAEQQAMLDNEIVGIAKARDRQTVWHNRALARMLGYGPGGLVGRPTHEVYADEADYRRVGQAYAELTEGRQYRTELQMQRTDGSLVWIDLSGVRLPDGQSMWVMVDISRMKASAADAEHRAGHDALTGLPNRSQLDPAIADAIHLARQGGHQLAVAFIDLDGFKSVNDELGHEAGDALLREVARRIGQGIRAKDLAARLGGDEFVVVLNEVDRREDVEPVLQRMLEALEAPVELPGGARVAVGASVGVALWPDDGRQADELMEAADQAMYAAKRAGKHRIQFSAPPSARSA
ncbi:MAG: diguanylate cyclase [Burkholderiales bacterium]|nr:diguanylate cyclase [Burkholderiales bacterium]